MVKKWYMWISTHTPSRTSQNLKQTPSLAAKCKALVNRHNNSQIWFCQHQKFWNSINTLRQRRLAKIHQSGETVDRGPLKVRLLLRLTTAKVPSLIRSTWWRSRWVFKQSHAIMTCNGITQRGMKNSFCILFRESQVQKPYRIQTSCFWFKKKEGLHLDLNPRQN